MSTCKYCGKDAGWFSKAHKECEDKHEQGVKDFEAIVSSYFTGRTTAVDVQRGKVRLTNETCYNKKSPALTSGTLNL